MLDAGITYAPQASYADGEREIREAGLMRPFIPASDFVTFKYQIDIDGNTNSWPGLFQKLLLGNPVLKVASPYGYRQWYYDRLRPWVHFIPVSSDMSDLVEKITWLRANDDVARRIGENGQALAMSLGYEIEVTAARRIIAAAVRYFAGRAETDLPFGPNIPPDVRLLDGWAAHHTDGLPALGLESRLELPRPVARENFILGLDISPFTDEPGPPAQRVTVVVNGEPALEATLSCRRMLRCCITLATIDAASLLHITLLHPDASSLASASRPLDDEQFSIILHQITLTPASIDARCNTTAMEALPLPPARPARQRFLKELYGPDRSLPEGFRLGRLKTYWGTVIFADTETGTLRHGPEASSPHNVVLAAGDGSAHLFHIGPDGHRYSIRIAPEGQFSDNQVTTDADIDGVQTFRALEASASQTAAIGLQYGQLLVCAEGDGRTTLSRRAWGPWERFELVEVRGSK